MWSSPRERGSSVRQRAGAAAPRVVPARAGVIRASRRSRRRGPRRPRASGGHPFFDSLTMTWGGSSPRERGSSPCPRWCPDAVQVVPARAGVIRPPRRSRRGMGRRPRASGGHPADRPDLVAGHVSSPRERGSSSCTGVGSTRIWVVPARAGVIPTSGRHRRRRLGRPRASGGHPIRAAITNRWLGSSPRERGSSGPGRGFP